MSEAGFRASARLLAAIFFLSGASSLIYQVVWQRLLTLYYGVGSISVTLIVSVYMLGLGLGALAGGWAAERLRSCMRAYSAIELAIGAFGVASLPLLEAIARWTAGGSYVTSLASMFLFLLVPTVLMGATLPLLVKAMNRLVSDFLLSVSLLYFINTLGAAFGALVTAYGLITFGGLDIAAFVAAGLNFALAGAVYALAQRVEPAEAAAPGTPATQALPLPRAAGLGRRVYLLVFASGFLAIGYEIVWFRVIGVLNKVSPYAFATSLAVYLLGIALGSYGLERLVAWKPGLSRVRLFFVLQFATGVLVVGLTTFFVAAAGQGAFAGLVEASFARHLHPASWAPSELLRVFAWPAYFVLLPTLLIGAGFPLLASLALQHPDREGLTVGRVYFVNTVGNLLGGVVCGFLLLEWLGSELTLLVFAATNMSMLLLAPAGSLPRLGQLGRLGLVAASVGLALWVFPAKGGLYARVHGSPGEGYDFFLQEGVDGVVATFERGSRVVNYINGMVHGGRPYLPYWVETTQALASAPRAERVLVIGFGTGTIVEAVLRSPDLEQLTLIELNRALVTNLRKMSVFREILDDPRLELIFDDGRRHLIREGPDYDLVMMDPLYTTSAYSNNIYSLEFFELVRARLGECGVFLVWTDDPVIVPRTLARAFAHARLYPLSREEGFVLASECRMERHPARLRRQLKALPPLIRAPLAPSMQRLRSVDPAGDEQLPINRDYRPRSEYYLGLARRTPAAEEKSK